MDIDQLHHGDPIPKLGCGGEKQVLSGLRNFHFGSRVRQLGALQFGIFRIDHEPSQERKESAEEDLVVAVIEAKVGNPSRAVDDLTDTGAAPESPGVTGFDQGIVESDRAGFLHPVAGDEPFDFGVVDERRFERAQGLEHLSTCSQFLGPRAFQERMRTVDPCQYFIDRERNRRQRFPDRRIVNRSRRESEIPPAGFPRATRSRRLSS